MSTAELARLFVSIKETGGWDGLTELIYNTAASLNGFDKYGHYGRTLLNLTACIEYIPHPGGYSGCVARFHGFQSVIPESETSARALVRLINRLDTERAKSAEAEDGGTAAEAPAASLGTARSAEATTPTERGAQA